MAVSDLVVGVVLAVLSWPESTHDLLNSHGLYGWQTSIAMAAQNHLEFGTQVIFTYGPLGFLDVPQLDYRWTAVSAFLFVLALSICIFTTLTWSLRRAVPVVPAVVVAYVVGTVAVRVQMGPEYVLALVLVACVALLIRSVDEPPPRGSGSDWGWCSPSSPW